MHFFLSRNIQAPRTYGILHTLRVSWGLWGMGQGMKGHCVLRGALLHTGQGAIIEHALPNRAVLQREPETPTHEALNQEP